MANQTPEQFLLPLRLDADASLDNFWWGACGPLAEALEALWRNSSELWLFLSGAAGSGKSHLLQALVKEAEGRSIDAIYIDCAEIAPLLELSLQHNKSEATSQAEDFVAELFAGFQHYALLCFDNLQALAGQIAWQRALFYLLVELKTSGHSKVVFAANNSAENLALELPDLVSRLQQAAPFRLQNYSDSDKLEILRHRAAAEGMDMPADVARYIVEREARDMHSLLAVLQRLGRMTLARRRKLTVPFVKEVLSL